MSSRVAGPSEYLAITGRGIDDIRLAKKAWVLPGQRCSRFDVSPVNYTFEVQAMSAEKQLPFVLLAVFTIGPRVDDKDSLLHYAKLKLSNHVNELIVQGVIEGETRVLAACMSMEEILKPTNEFTNEVFQKVQLQLNQFGLLIYNAKVKQLVDVHGHEYFPYLGGQKTQMEAANGRAEDRLSMADIVFVGSEPKRLLLKKKLSRDDLKKLYLPKQVKVTDLCPAALASDSPNRFELFIYDSEKTRWQMTLRETSKDRWHLIGGWSQFATRWNFSEGQEIHFFEYTCNTQAKFLLISPLPQPFRFYV